MTSPNLSLLLRFIDVMEREAALSAAEPRREPEHQLFFNMFRDMMITWCAGMRKLLDKEQPNLGPMIKICGQLYAITLSMCMNPEDSWAKAKVDFEKDKAEAIKLLHEPTDTLKALMEVFGEEIAAGSSLDIILAAMEKDYDEGCKEPNCPACAPKKAAIEEMRQIIVQKRAKKDR